MGPIEKFKLEMSLLHEKLTNISFDFDTIQKKLKIDKLHQSSKIGKQIMSIVKKFFKEQCTPDC